MNEWAGHLPREDALELRNVDARAIGRIVRECSATKLRLYHVTAPSLDGLDALTGVTNLSIHWAPKIASLAPICLMVGLRRLALVDLARIRALDGIERLAGLLELDLQGGMWKPLRLSSLRPIAGLSTLERLTVLNTRLDDDDIAFLAAVRTLRAIHLSNQFDRLQVARLARALNQQLERPLAAYQETNLTCEVCGGKKRMFTGRRMPLLCATCDAARVASLTEEFQAMVDGAGA